MVELDAKIRLDADTVMAIDYARTLEMPIPSRMEMIRRLIGIGLAQNLKMKAQRNVQEELAAAKQRTVESRERTAKLKAGLPTVERKLPVLERELGRVFGKPKKA